VKDNPYYQPLLLVYSVDRSASFYVFIDFVKPKKKQVIFFVSKSKSSNQNYKDELLTQKKKKSEIVRIFNEGDAATSQVFSIG
jgi:hypothetical protein